jgi:hypothetical protein
VRSDIREYLPNSRVVAASLSMDGVPITSLGEYRVQTWFFPRTVSYKINTYMSYALTWYIHRETIERLAATTRLLGKYSLISDRTENNFKFLKIFNVNLVELVMLVRSTR